MLTRLKTETQRIERRLAQRNKPKTPVVYLDPLFFATHSLGFEPDPWQERVLTWRGKRLLLNCCRQSGKSTTTAILALHRAYYFARSLVLLVSPSLRQSAELFKKVVDFLNLLAIWPQLTEDNRLSLQMTNGSRIVSLPAKEANIRGFSGASLIIEDEASRVSDDLYLAMRPMLAVSHGQLILMSTPWGMRGHFFSQWENGGESWERIKVDVYSCPRISPEFIAEEKASMPDSWFRAEYLGEFTETEDSVFRYDDVRNAFSADIKPLFPIEPRHGTPALGVAPLVRM